MGGEGTGCRAACGGGLSAAETFAAASEREVTGVGCRSARPRAPFQTEEGTCVGGEGEAQGAGPGS